MDLRYVYTLEDTYHEKKISGVTRIPEGFYDVKPRPGGRIYDAYCKSSIEDIRAFTQKYGVLEVLNVPDFNNVLIHTGNTDTDTEGCLLVGDMANNNSAAPGFVSNSMLAYARFILTVGFWLERGETIRLEINDFDREINRLI